MLDLGCGYGVAGILAGKLVMVTKRLDWNKNKLTAQGLSKKIRRKQK